MKPKTPTAPFLDWDARFTTGVEIVDRQHRGLIELINRLYRQVGEGRGEAVILGVCGELQRYALDHFGTEERLMRQYGIHDREQSRHVAEHEDYRQRIETLRQRHLRGERLVPVQVLSFVSDWWRGHILHFDRLFERHAEKVSPDKTADAGAGRP